MPLMIGQEKVITAHASKTSKLNLLLFEAHTSVLIPLLALPGTLFTLSINPSIFKIIAYSCLTSVVVLIVLERRGITLVTGLKRIRSRLSGRHRRAVTRGRMKRRLKLNSFENR